MRETQSIRCVTKPCMIFKTTVQKTLYLKEHGFNVVEVWECDVKQELEQNEDMKSFFDSYDLTDLWNLMMPPLVDVLTLQNCSTNVNEDEKIRCVA